MEGDKGGDKFRDAYQYNNSDCPVSRHQHISGRDRPRELGHTKANEYYIIVMYTAVPGSRVWLDNPVWLQNIHEGPMWQQTGVNWGVRLLCTRILCGTALRW